jgi:protein-S-isoprenylcysteine O-methyltransferase Ste14
MTDAIDLSARPALRRRIGMWTLEIGERALVAVLYYGLVERLLSNYAHTRNIADLLTLASESLVVLLAMIRKPAKEVSLRPLDWLIAFGGSFLSLLLVPAQVAALGPQWIGWSLQTIAVLGQFGAKVFLFRNFGIAPALRGVAQSGPYAIVRHPMYAAYFVGLIGFLYAFPTIWNVALIAVWCVAQVLRVFAEERVLSQSPLYREYLLRVRWRVIPGLF